MRAVLINLLFEQMNSSCSIPVTDVFRCLEQRLIVGSLPINSQ